MCVNWENYSLKGLKLISRTPIIKKGVMFEKKDHGLPWNELIDRLYYRQDAEDILQDFIKRGLVKEEKVPKIREMIQRLKQSVDEFRLFPHEAREN